MPTLNAGDFRKGVKIIHEGQPYEMLECQFVKPGKGQALYRTRLRNLLTGKNLSVKGSLGFANGGLVEANIPNAQLDAGNRHCTEPHAETCCIGKSRNAFRVLCGELRTCDYHSVGT